ncbi:MAG TPA: hypothetical protein VL360_02895 [Gammaproteobacteria bacterium]|jgi:hypothetical protein|nr:hypothetical protein [Gammaproteobacteria bacterium]
MGTKKQHGNSSKILKLILFIPTVLSLIGNLFALMQSEVSLMRRKIIMLVMLSVFSFVLMTTAWICINWLLFTWMVHLYMSSITATILLLAFNLLLFVITCLLIALLNIDPSFPETRKAINNILSK